MLFADTHCQAHDWIADNDGNVRALKFESEELVVSTKMSSSSQELEWDHIAHLRCNWQYAPDVPYQSEAAFYFYSFSDDYTVSEFYVVWEKEGDPHDPIYSGRGKQSSGGYFRVSSLKDLPQDARLRRSR